MKKCLIFIIFLILLENVILEDICMGSTLDINDCIGKLSQDKKDANCYCCLFTGTSKEGYQVSQCIELQKIQYDYIEEIIQDKKKSYENPSIKCKSYYLHLSIIVLLFLL